MGLYWGRQPTRRCCWPSAAWWTQTISGRGCQRTFVLLCFGTIDLAELKNLSLEFRVGISLVARFAVRIRKAASGQSCPHHLLCKPRSQAAELTRHRVYDSLGSDSLCRTLVTSWKCIIKRRPIRSTGCTSSLTIGAWRPSTKTLTRTTRRPFFLDLPDRASLRCPYY